MKSTPWSVRCTRVPLLVEHEQQVVLDVAVALLARPAACGRRCARAPSSARAACCPAPAAPSSAACSSGCPAAPCRACSAAVVRVARLERRARASPTSWLTSSVCRRTRRATAALCSKYIASLSFPTGPEMMSGVRASSMSTESTSSTIAKMCAPLHALVERRRPCCRAGSRSRTRCSCRT